ncbi:unnamed protein product [Toxocara canis]|nr:unnamed protein product [Toxocara canis]
MFDGLGGILFSGPVRPFDMQLRCFSAPFFGRADSDKINELNHGGKILLPPSALDLLVRLNIEYPMMFRVSCINEPLRFTHCGVLEFLAEEGRCYLPSWMMRQLHLSEGDCVRITYTSLPSATYAKFKPQSTDFLSISNPRAMLEVELRKFACLTKGDVIAVQYNEQLLEFLVMEVKPGNAVAIIECDMNVEFDAPEGYVEPSSSAASSATTKPIAPPRVPSVGKGLVAPADKKFAAFGGSGHRLDGKTRSSQSSLSELADSESKLPQLVVETDYKPGSLTFVRYDYKNRSLMEKELDKAKSKGGAGNATPFGGLGQTIRERR